MLHRSPGLQIDYVEFAEQGDLFTPASHLVQVVIDVYECHRNSFFVKFDFYFSRRDDSEEPVRPALFRRSLNDVTHASDLANYALPLASLRHPHACELCTGDFPFLKLTVFDVCHWVVVSFHDCPVLLKHLARHRPHSLPDSDLLITPPANRFVLEQRINLPLSILQLRFAHFIELRIS